MIAVRKIEPLDAVCFPENEAFPLWGRLIPSYDGKAWTYGIQEWTQQEEMTFPPFAYDRTDLALSFYGAFDGEDCIGLAVYRQGTFRYLYLEELKVNRSYRRQGVGEALIAAGMAEAVASQQLGLYTIAQDNNLSACLFYLKQGFEIGGFDNRCYRGTPQESKADIFFYLDGPTKEK